MPILMKKRKCKEVLRICEVFKTIDFFFKGLAVISQMFGNIDIGYLAQTQLHFKFQSFVFKNKNNIKLFPT
jgi:hypothetical protein